MLFEVIGWFGTILYLLNHTYLSLSKAPRLIVYNTNNLVAGAALVISSWYQSSYQSVAINILWVLVSGALILDISLNRGPMTRDLFYRLMAAYGSLVVAVLVSGLSPEHALRDWLGWASPAIFGFSYLLFGAGAMSKVEYMLLNCLAASIVTPALVADKNHPALFLEVCWSVISIVGAAKEYSAKKGSAARSQ